MKTPLCMKAFARRFRELWEDSSGQAATEYVMTTTILLIGGLGAVAGWPYFGGLMGALNTYLQSVQFVLNMALP